MLRIDVQANKAPFEQVRDGIVAAIAAGELVAGEKLPTVRGLAADLGLAANTVARAYLELERAGVIVTRGRRGSFVAEATSAHSVPPEAHLAAHAFVEEMTRLGVGHQQALELFEHHWRR